ncbi:hypothetical protein EV126DRAFT_158024 [Verticillium dahliae]|nr:hypothetical protein EV126DRAFT_158024 [Verticillium dahliae]
MILRNEVRHKYYPSMEIWAISCIFIEVAVWIVGGHPEVRSFAERRRGQTSLRQVEAGAADSFHDGIICLLPCVTDVLAWIHKHRQPDDLTTPNIVLYLLNGALRQSESMRPTANTILSSIEKIIEREADSIPLIHSTGNQVFNSSTLQGNSDIAQHTMLVLWAQNHAGLFDRDRNRSSEIQIRPAYMHTGESKEDSGRPVLLSIAATIPPLAPVPLSDIQIISDAAEKANIRVGDAGGSVFGIYEPLSEQQPQDDGSWFPTTLVQQPAHSSAVLLLNSTRVSGRSDYRETTQFASTPRYSYNKPSQHHNTPRIFAISWAKHSSVSSHRAATETSEQQSFPASPASEMARCPRIYIYSKVGSFRTRTIQGPIGRKKYYLLCGRFKDDVTFQKRHHGICGAHCVLHRRYKARWIGSCVSIEKQQGAKEVEASGRAQLLH